VIRHLLREGRAPADELVEAGTGGGSALNEPPEGAPSARSPLSLLHATRTSGGEDTP
jgi:hypothetical protein